MACLLCSRTNLYNHSVGFRLLVFNTLAVLNLIRTCLGSCWSIDSNIVILLNLAVKNIGSKEWFLLKILICCHFDQVCCVHVSSFELEIEVESFFVKCCMFCIELLSHWSYLCLNLKIRICSKMEFYCLNWAMYNILIDKNGSSYKI